MTTLPLAQAVSGGRRIGYARVSTAEQCLDLQLDALERAGCDLIFADQAASGASRDRPKLQEALNAIGPGDVLVAWKLDRITRSLRDLIDIVEALRAKSAHFECLTERIETVSAHGEFVFHMIGALAQMERRLISERTRAGLAARRARGQRLGRPRKCAAKAHDGLRGSFSQAC